MSQDTQAERTLQISDQRIVIQPITPLQSDDRGWMITTGITPQQDPVTQHTPRLISTNPGQIRGNHYHPQETETMIFLNGLWEAIFADSRGKFKQTAVLDCQTQPFTLTVPPTIAHAFTNQSSTTAYLFHYSDRPYDKGRSVKINL